jgi:hypothetical protein
MLIRFDAARESLPVSPSFVKKPNLVTRQIAGETVVVPVSTGVADMEAIFTLNDVGTSIWDLVNGQNTAEQITHAICQEYEVTQAEATNDVCCFLSGLEAAGLIDRVPPGKEIP